jgi:hypothetical protein
VNQTTQIKNTFTEGPNLSVTTVGIGLYIAAQDTPTADRTFVKKFRRPATVATSKTIGGAA